MINIGCQTFANIHWLPMLNQCLALASIGKGGFANIGRRLAEHGIQVGIGYQCKTNILPTIPMLAYVGEADWAPIFLWAIIDNHLFLAFVPNKSTSNLFRLVPCHYGLTIYQTVFSDPVHQLPKSLKQFCKIQEICLSTKLLSI